MRQLELFQSPKAQSLSITGKAVSGKQSRPSGGNAASYDIYDYAPCETCGGDADWGDIYDEYVDFEVCSREWL